MSRRMGQLTTRGALAGLGAVVAVLAAIVALSAALLEPPEVPTPPPAPPPQTGAGPVGTVDCPEIASLPPAPIPVSSGEVIDCPQTYDGRVVAFEGEVVNAVLRRGDRAWVQLNDDAYGLELGPLPTHRSTVGTNSGLSVSVPIAVVDRIAHVGGHRTGGDVLAVEGVFHRADPADGGALTIAASRAVVTRVGRPYTHPVQVDRLVVAGVLGLLTLGLVGTTVRARRED